MAFDFKQIADKKVAGVPVLYLGLGAAVIFAVVAWKMKADTPDGGEAESNASGMADAIAGDAAENDYAGLATQGTVTVVQQAANADAESVKETNEDWERTAVRFLIDSGTPAGEAQAAMHHYLSGDDLTFEQGQLRDAAVKKLGIPPEPLVELGNTSPRADAPAQKQFSLFPGKHVVKGVNDNTAARLAVLYYGNNNVTLNARMIAAANTGFGPAMTAYNPGTVLVIPAWHQPKYVYASKTMATDSAVASKNGLSVTALRFLNPDINSPYKVGQRVRVS